MSIDIVPCPNCGKSLSVYVKTCPACGLLLHAPKKRFGLFKRPPKRHRHVLDRAYSQRGQGEGPPAEEPDSSAEQKSPRTTQPHVEQPGASAAPTNGPPTSAPGNRTQLPGVEPNESLTQRAEEAKAPLPEGTPSTDSPGTPPSDAESVETTGHDDSTQLPGPIEPSEPNTGNVAPPSSVAGAVESASVTRDETPASRNATSDTSSVAESATEAPVQPSAPAAPLAKREEDEAREQQSASESTARSAPPADDTAVDAEREPPQQEVAGDAAVADDAIEPAAALPAAPSPAADVVPPEPTTAPVEAKKEALPEPSETVANLPAPDESSTEIEGQIEEKPTAESATIALRDRAAITDEGPGDAHESADGADEVVEAEVVEANEADDEAVEEPVEESEPEESESVAYAPARPSEQKQIGKAVLLIVGLVVAVLVIKIVTSMF